MGHQEEKEDMNKKGDFLQIFFLLIMLFVAAIVFLITYSWADPIQQEFKEFAEEQQGNNSVAFENLDKVATYTPIAFDYFIFFFWLGGIIGLMISAVRTDFSVGILFIYLLVMMIAVLVASGLVNIYQGFAQAPALADLASNLTLTNLIFNRWLPLMVSVIGAFVLILMYSKSGADISI